MGPLTVIATFGVANAILLEAGLSFLGLAVQAPEPSLGNMSLEARERFGRRRLARRGGDAGVAGLIDVQICRLSAGSSLASARSVPADVGDSGEEHATRTGCVELPALG